MIILCLYIISCLLEAWNEVAVIDLKNPDLPRYQVLNHQEHFRSGVWAAYLMGMAVMAAILCYDYWIVAAIFVSRRAFFDYALALWRSRPTSIYEGNDWWENVFVNVFGKRGRKKELLVECLIIATAIILHFKMDQPFSHWL